MTASVAATMAAIVAAISFEEAVLAASGALLTAATAAPWPAPAQPASAAAITNREKILRFINKSYRIWRKFAIPRAWFLKITKNPTNLRPNPLETSLERILRSH
jgi:CBS domain containing-hemolysin-like protein